MPFITFIYRVGKNKQFFYGKYVCDYISDDHEGLDSEILPVLAHGVNEYRKQRGLNPQPVHVGVLSFSTNEYIPTYSTDQEIYCFDFYHIRLDDKNTTYVNGKLI